VTMGSNSNENFGEVKPKSSAEKALQRWRNLCRVLVKKPRCRFRFSADLPKRNEAAAMRHTTEVSSFSFLRNIRHSNFFFQKLVPNRCVTIL
jgi:hypothetical protein